MKTRTMLPVLATAALALTLTGCGSPATQIAGSIVVPSQYRSENGCLPEDGYDDVFTGTQVTVKDGAGKILGTGDLDYDETSPGNTESHCEFVFDFTVSSAAFYEIEVAHRGSLTYSAEELSEGPLRFSLGD